MYKALVVAYNNGLINGSESRWDEGVTKGDFLEILTNTYLAMPATISADKGIMNEYDTTIPDEDSTEVKSEDNSGSYNTSISTEDTTYCEFESIAPTTLYPIAAGTMYGNPNLYEGALTTEGGYSINEELIFNYKTTYNDVEYYVIKNETGLILMVRADQLSETPVEVSAESKQPADTQGSSGTSTSGNSNNGGVYGDINPNQPAGSLAAKMTDEQLVVYIKRLQDAGWTQQQIEDRLYSNSNSTGTNYVDGGSADRDPSTYTDEELELLKQGAGMTVH